MRKSIILFFLLLSVAALQSATVVKDGKMLFHGIVTPEKPLPAVSLAARELAYHLKCAVGKSLPVISEKAVKPGKKYFYLGNCRFNAALSSSRWPWCTGTVKINKDSIQIAGNDGSKKIYSDNNSTGTLFAVYEFLEKYLGTRWIWPGKSGEVIPRCRTLALKETSFTVKPLLLSSDFRTGVSRLTKKGWSSKKQMQSYYASEQLWLLRHRFNHNNTIMGGHAFTRYYDKYHREHPDYFSMLPDGKRRPNPLKWSRKTAYVSLCVSNPELVRQIVHNWSTIHKGKILNINENDAAGECVCDNCLAADNSPVPAAERRAAAKERFDKKDRTWPYALGSVSDRYCKFFLAVQKEADKIDPKHNLTGLIYANYSEPPSKNIKLNDRMFLRFCPPIMYPLTREKIDTYKRLWKGWARTGARLQFRPNFTWSGNYFPVQYHKEFYEIFTFALKHNMMTSDMDALTGQHMVQGLVDYVIVSLNHRKDVPLAQLEDEFYSFFGKAKKPVKKYFDYVTALTMERGFPKSSLEEQSLEGGMNLARYMVRVGDTLFTPEVMAKCFKLLEEAANTPGLDKKSAYRVKMLHHGLTHVKLAMQTQDAFRKWQKGAPLENFYKEHEKLQKFRRSIASTYLINLGRLYYYDDLSWFRPIRAYEYKLKHAKK